MSPLRRSIVFGGPSLVGLVNLAHPLIRPPIFRAVTQHLPWWTTLHLLNLLLFPILGLAAYLLIKDVQGIAALLSKIAIVIFIPVYVAFDALAGVGTGILVGQGRAFSPANLPAIESLIDSYWTSPVISLIAATGSIAWVIAMLSASVAFADVTRRRFAAICALLVFVVGGWAQVYIFLPSVGGPIPLLWWLITFCEALAVFLVANPRIPATFLTLAALLFGASHVTPTGPIGMLCFLIAAIYLAPPRS